MKFRYFFDPGSGMCLWAADDETRAVFGYPVELEKLNLPEDTVALGNRLISFFDGSIDWEYPSGPSLWAEEQRSQFLRESLIFYGRLVAELGSEFTVINEVRA